MSVTVLTTNGRRQNIKVTPNTTILEIIEEACRKEGLIPEEYDLRHHRTVLTCSSTVRFSGVPQNGHLELIPAKTRRVESNVTLCLQLESGDRKQGECQPSEVLWTVMTRIVPEVSEMRNPVVVYMRREVVGMEALTSTSLRSIGLMGGRAIIRILNRTLDQLHTQANVSAPLTRPTPPPEPEVTPRSKEAVKTLFEAPAVPNESQSVQVPIANDEQMEVDAGDESKGSDMPQQIANAANQFCNAVEHLCSEEASSVSSSVTEEMEGLEVKKIKSEEQRSSNSAQEEVISEKVILLGDRNAVAYNTDSMPVTEPEDFPDDFFELTVNDVRSLYAAAKRATDELNTAPLLTRQQRDLDHDGLVLQKLSQYKSCVIRVRLPDRTVLQGCFKPVETITAVVDFVREYLDKNELDFYLYTAPPKTVLNAESTLIEADCVPSAILYLGLTNPGNTAPSVFLRANVVAQFSSPIAAFQAAKENRMNINNHSKGENKTSLGGRKPTPSTSAAAGVSNSQRCDSPPKKIPKWFKIGK